MILAQPTSKRDGSRSRSSFTLTELLVVMGVIALLAGLTAISYRTVAKDAKLSSGKNTVMAVLDNARAMAMKRNKPTMVMFVPRLVNQKESRVEAVIAQWTGTVNNYVVDVPSSPCFSGSSNERFFERFVVVNGIAPRQLPKGISVAGPDYKTCGNEDKKWFFPPNPLKPNEAAGRAVGVLYLADGTTATHVPSSATIANNYPYIDFDGDGGQDRTLVGTNIDLYYMMLDSTDEPCAELVPFLTVFDEEQARDIQGDDDWNDIVKRKDESSDYINANADRIHFNRYTGVAMK